MKNTIQILIVLFLLSTCRGQDENTFHPIVLKAKETSLYTKNINWNDVNKNFLKLTEGKENIEDLKPGLQYLINSLGDKHAQIRSPKDHSLIVYYTGEIKEEDHRESEFINTVINNISTTFSYQLLDNNIGYLKVVGIGPGDVKAQADMIRRGLIILKEKEVDKWIVDLRSNGGGNMEPMISGLAPLIGEGDIGGSIDIAGNISPLKIENAQFYNYNRLACSMPNLPKIKASEKVVVLLSRYTVSSGEMTAIAFKGRENTLFIGEPSGGYTTGNGYDIVTDDLALVISKSIFIDRNKKKYDGRVDVDVFSEFQHLKELNNDHQIEKATLWLTKKE
jgi:C-terminal processing protease CtpA/Prc